MAVRDFLLLRSGDSLLLRTGDKLTLRYSRQYATEGVQVDRRSDDRQWAAEGVQLDESATVAPVTPSGIIPRIMHHRRLMGVS